MGITPQTTGMSSISSQGDFEDVITKLRTQGTPRIPRERPKRAAAPPTSPLSESIDFSALLSDMGMEIGAGDGEMGAEGGGRGGEGDYEALMAQRLLSTTFKSSFESLWGETEVEGEEKQESKEGVKEEEQGEKESGKAEKGEEDNPQPKPEPPLTPKKSPYRESFSRSSSGMTPAFSSPATPGTTGTPSPMDAQLAAGIAGLIWPESPSPVSDVGDGRGMAGAIPEEDEGEEVLEEGDVTMDAATVRGHMSEGEEEEGV